MPKFAPLSAGFMVASMLGFLLTILFVYPASTSWGFAFAIVFVLMFVASFISMGNAPVNDREFYRELSVHNIANRKGVLLKKEEKINKIDNSAKTNRDIANISPEERKRMDAQKNDVRLVNPPKKRKK